MKLESQVISLKLAKEMKELGFKQKSLWYWTEKNNKWVVKVTYEVYYEDYYSAYTVAELGEIIKCTFHYVKAGKNLHNVLIPHNVYLCDDNIPSQTADTEANTRAKMLIYLKKDKV